MGSGCILENAGMWDFFETYHFLKPLIDISNQGFSRFLFSVLREIRQNIV
jgi:hypothetical protein